MDNNPSKRSNIADFSRTYQHFADFINKMGVFYPTTLAQ